MALVHHMISLRQTSPRGTVPRRTVQAILQLEQNARRFCEIAYVRRCLHNPIYSEFQYDGPLLYAHGRGV